MKMDERFEEDMEVSDQYVVEDKWHDKKYTKRHGKEYEHKLMTMEDVANELAGDLSDEISDSRKYFCMAKIAEKSHNEDDSHYLFEMSKDEYTHAYFIHSFMLEHDMRIPEDQEVEFEELKEKMKEFF